MKIEINTDDSCKFCKEGIKHLKKLWKRNRDAYACYILHPLPKTDKDFLGRKIKGIVLTPDYNTEGHLTHWHVWLNLSGYVTKPIHILLLADTEANVCLIQSDLIALSLRRVHNAM